MLRKALFVILLITFVTLIAAFFTNERFTFVCTNSLITCLDAAGKESSFEKIESALVCIFYNVICVFNQVRYIF